MAMNFHDSWCKRKLLVNYVSEKKSWSKNAPQSLSDSKLTWFLYVSVGSYQIRLECDAVLDSWSCETIIVYPKLIKWFTQHCILFYFIQSHFVWSCDKQFSKLYYFQQESPVFSWKKNTPTRYVEELKSSPMFSPKLELKSLRSKLGFCAPLVRLSWKGPDWNPLHLHTTVTGY